MKGYQMVLLVNSALFFLTTFVTLAYAGAVARQADRCVPPEPGHVGPDCAQIRKTSIAAYHAAPWLLVVAIVLLGTGVASGWLRPKPPPVPPSDETR